jgi:hemerythrin-like domain-containing protein
LEETSSQSRREFLRLGAALAGAAVLAPAGLLAQEKKHEAPVNPTEDLMREHAVLGRILLIYERLLAPINAGQPFPADVLVTSTGIIRRFVEDYHEKLEEKYLFPRFEKAGRLVDLVKVLCRQHEAGRHLTDITLEQAGLARAGKPCDRGKLSESMLLFIRMYNPHKARESTVLFPALRAVVSPAEFNNLGEVFEDRERQLFGKSGFEGVVGQVAELEKTLGIYDLNQFTPPGAPSPKC